MTEFPQMVGGPHYFDIDLMKITGGKVVTKEGAKGYIGIGVMEGESDTFNGSIGITIKTRRGDANHRASSLICLIILEKLGALSKQELPALSEYYIRPIKNWRNKDIGEIRPPATFLKALDKIIQ